MNDTDHSPTLGALAKALATAQGALEDAKKDAFNPHFKTRFASLASVRAAITPVFSKHGLAVTQLNEPHGDAGVCVVTMLMHESGEWLRSKLFVPTSKKDAQGFGSALSYARRYALASIAGIASDDDDDAEIATKVPTKAPVSVPKSTNGASKSDQADKLIVAIATAKNADEFSSAVLAFADYKRSNKLDGATIERARAAHDETMRRLEAEQAA